MFWGKFIRIAFELLKMVGRWVLRRVSERGRTRILEYMREKIDTFSAKAEAFAKEGKTLRAGWYRFRMRNWTKVAQWLEKHWGRITRAGAKRIDRAIDRLHERAASELPDQVPCECFESWQLNPAWTATA